MSVERRLSRRILLIVLVFGALSAFGGGALGVLANGAGVPIDYLANSPFTSYVVPGLVLAVAVGGTQLAAAVTLFKKLPAGDILAVIAGFGMLIWIFVELAVISEYSWLQSVYFAVGIVELLLVFTHIGLVSDVVPRA